MVFRDQVDGSIAWKRSSYSHPNGNCVEVCRRSGGVAVRDSKRPTGGYLAATPTQWKTFLEATKNDVFTNSRRRCPTGS
ncbi:DUF397 domain-containing protein [Saccharopolyspora sp. ID03-671]